MNAKDIEYIESLNTRFARDGVAVRDHEPAAARLAATPMRTIDGGAPRPAGRHGAAVGASRQRPLHIDLVRFFAWTGMAMGVCLFWWVTSLALRWLVMR